MIFEKSCGALIFRKNNDQLETIIIQMISGHWSYPKGHMEKGETETETAVREIKEETNLDVTLDTRFREITSYSPKPNVIKDVIFFIAYAKNNNVIVQETEVQAYQWLKVEDALSIVTYDEDKKILRKAIKYLMSQY